MFTFELVDFLFSLSPESNDTAFSGNAFIESLNFEGQAAIGSYLMITTSDIRLLGS